MSCDACPQVFRPACRGIDLGNDKADWFCGECHKLKHRFTYPSTKREVVSKSKAVLGVLDEITGGRVLCHIPDFERGAFCDKTSIICDQCEREFHVGCLRKHKMCHLSSIPKGKWFCSRACKGVHGRLSQMGAPGFWSGRNPPRWGLPESYTWDVLRGEGTTEVSKAALAQALSILQASFDPLADVITGVDLLPIMVRAQTYDEHDFTNTHTILLRCEGKAVCAAVLRICGQFLAELPFVATEPTSRHQGHCRHMFAMIENLLADLSVRKLCLQAADKTLNTWVKSFGFHIMEDAEFRRAKADFRILTFPGTTVVEKAMGRQ